MIGLSKKLVWELWIGVCFILIPISLSAQYNYSFPNPRLLVNTIFTIDTIPIYIQIRSLEDNCVRLWSDYEGVDTSFNMQTGDVINLKWRSDFDAQEYQDANLPKQRLVNVAASQPVSIAYFLNTTRNLDTAASVNSSPQNCRERFRSEATDLLPTQKWGTETQINYPADQRLVTAAPPFNNFTNTLISDNSNILALIVDSITLTTSSQSNPAMCFAVSSMGFATFYGDTVVMPPQSQALQMNNWFFFAKRTNAYRYKSLVEVPFSVVGTFQTSIGGIGYLDNGIEQFSSKNYASTQHYIPVGQYDSVLVSVSFWENGTQLSLNSTPLGVFDADSSHHFFIHEPSLISTSGPAQVMVKTPHFPTTLQYPNSTFYQHVLGTVFRVDGPSHFIKKTLFQAMAPLDSSASAHLALVCRTTDIAQMQLNGQPVGTTAFSPFQADGQYSYADIPLNLRGKYLLENPGGFMAVHYTKPQDLSGYIGVYSMLLNEIHEPENRNIRWRNEKSEAWQISSPARVCQGKYLHLLPPEARNTTWVWQLPDGSTQTQRVDADSALSLAINTTLPAGSYTIIACDSTDCLPCDTLLVEVVPFDFEIIEAGVRVGCEGRTLLARAEGTDGLQYSWRKESQKIGDGPMVFVLIEPDSSYTLELTVSNEYCDSVVEVIIEDDLIEDELVVPNVFTPNDDGRNDCFSVLGADLYRDCFVLRIYNRWGQEVYTTRNPDECWDGRSRGAPLPEGVYFYIIELGQAEIVKGSLNLFR